MKVVEFVGLPGSGKTTCKSRFMTRYSGECVDQDMVYLLDRFGVSKIFFLQKILRFSFFRKLKSVFVLLSALSANLNRSLENNAEIIFLNAYLSAPESRKSEASFFYSKVMLAMRAYCAFDKARQNSSQAVALFDEGPAQRGLSLARIGFSDDGLREYFDLASKPDVLLVMRLNKDLIAERVLRRDKKDDRLLRYQNEMERALDLCESIYASHGIEVVKIDCCTADYSVDEMIKKIFRG